jgi:hypothetical protein
MLSNVNTDSNKSSEVSTRRAVRRIISRTDLDTQIMNDPLCVTAYNKTPSPISNNVLIDIPAQPKYTHHTMASNIPPKRDLDQDWGFIMRKKDGPVKTTKANVGETSTDATKNEDKKSLLKLKRRQRECWEVDRWIRLGRLRPQR